MERHERRPDRWAILGEEGIESGFRELLDRRSACRSGGADQGEKWSREELGWCWRCRPPLPGFPYGIRKRGTQGLPQHE